MRSFTIEGGVTVALRRSARARRMVLRVPHAGGGAVLTLPSHVALADGQAFAESRRAWLEAALSRRPPARAVGPGVLLPVEGRALKVTPAAVRAPRIEGEALLLPGTGAPGPVAAAFLKQLALARLRPECDRLTALLGRPARAIVLRDTRSRWGSCTQDGRLMFSWRLAMAPPLVLVYVAAHEVAHLAHMDHSPRFWSEVERLMPGHGPQRAWLKQNGAALMLWQFRD